MEPILLFNSAWPDMILLKSILPSFHPLLQEIQKTGTRWAPGFPFILILRKILFS